METITQISRILLPLLGSVILAWSLFSLLRRQPETGTGVFLQNSANGDKFPLRYGETSIGRSKTCDIIFNYPTVSRLHAVLAQRKKGWFIVDTRSTTGTNVNGEPAKKRVTLKDGDVITLGGLTLVFCAESETADIPVARN
jgi:cell division protein FtsW